MFYFLCLDSLSLELSPVVSMKLLCDPPPLTAPLWPTANEDDRFLFAEPVLTCHGRESPGLNNNTN